MSTTPWNDRVEGVAVPALINADGRFIRVQAGPGSGKTFGLKRRVERLLHPSGGGHTGQDVLVVAFNRVIAKSLQEEIEQRLSEAGSKETPTVRTVHALCLETIGFDVRLLLQHEREAMLYDVLEHHSVLLELYEKHSAAEQALRDHEASIQQHLQLWQACQQWLTRHQAALISDLPRMVLDAIDAGGIDRTYACVVVDEFQDLTPAEQTLMHRLVGDSGHLLALGDSRQSIYAFRGNDRQGLSRLDEWAAAANATVTDIPIPECRRCPAQIVHAANALMSLSSEAAMVPASQADAQIEHCLWKNPEQEARGMAERILDGLAKHPEDQHLAMVTRRQFGFLLRDAIRDLDPDVTVDLNFEEGHLESWPVREAFLFLSLVIDADPSTWRAWFSYQAPTAKRPFKAPKRIAAAYLRFLASTDDAITQEAVEALALENRNAPRGAGGTLLWDRASRFAQLAGSIHITDLTPTQLVESVLDDVHWLVGIHEGDEAASAELDVLRTTLLEAIVAGEPGLDESDVLEREIRSLRYKIATRMPLTEPGESHLYVTTLWGAKGVTADHVYLIGLFDETLPGHRRPEYPGTDIEYMEEQRRLFYVSLTRCKETLVLSRPDCISQQDARRLGITTGPGYWPKLKPSRFLRDIREYIPPAERRGSW